MRLLSKLVLSYAAVATALTNVGFGGKRKSYKHLQELDLGLDCDSHRLGAVAIAFVLGAQNLAAIPGGAPNLALARLAGWEYWLRGDAWSDPNPKGMVCIIPSSFIAIWSTLWYVNNDINNPGTSGLPGNGIVHFTPTGAVYLAAVVKDDAGTAGVAGDHPAEAGNAFLFVQNAVAGATLYGRQGLPFVDVTAHPNHCCAPPDRRVTCHVLCRNQSSLISTPSSRRRVGPSKSRQHRVGRL
ncbi:unnamed protein product [Pelagomonas calceolata]|uniref:Uncharacterized protein n=1 Tax=Pelagomonas calceolata TaxID=35677 RepID=A0A8J2WSG9_9STRA|nr:unnamed protein product [Pelagomonas calceolata]